MTILLDESAHINRDEKNFYYKLNQLCKIKARESLYYEKPPKVLRNVVQNLTFLYS